MKHMVYQKETRGRLGCPMPGLVCETSRGAKEPLFVTDRENKGLGLSPPLCDAQPKPVGRRVPRVAFACILSWGRCFMFATADTHAHNATS